MNPARRPWRIAAAAWAVVILAFGLLPTQRAVETISGGHDTLATTAGHFAAYLVLGWLLAAASGGPGVDLTRALSALTVAAVLGGAIELAQGPLPYRDAQLADFVVNIAGAATGLILFSVAGRAMRARSHRG